jgi:hypothetical protein
MKPEKHVRPHAADWYVISDDGRSALRLCHGVRIGESDTGALTINDPAAEGDWVDIDFSDGLVPVLRLLRTDLLMLLECGQRVERYQLSYGVTVQLPSNALHIGPDIGAVEPTGVVVRIVESGPAVAPTIEPSIEPSAPASVVPMTSDRDRRRSRGRWRRTPVALATLFALVAAAVVYLPQTYLPQTLDLDVPMAPPREALRPVENAPTTDVVALQPSGVDASVPVDAGTAPQPDSAPVVAVPAEVVTRPATRITAPVAAGTDQRLIRARQLLRTGRVTYPPGNNAVAILTDLLAEDPDDEAALDLLEAATGVLVVQARQAHEQGRDYEARNLLEEALALSPRDARANRLWREWVGARRRGRRRRSGRRRTSPRRWAKPAR